MIKIVLEILLISLPVLSFKQSELETKRIYLGITKKVPVQNAKAYYDEYTGTNLYSQSDGLVFEPLDDSVFSVCLSTTSAVFDLGNGKTIVTRDSLNRFYTYTNLREVYLEKGSVIKKGSLIGLMNVKNDKPKEFLFMITNKNGNNWNGEKIWQLIKDE